ncbi:MAG TPA: TetR/AcrR family transcriptional regulator [Paraburkholderia sp.]|nr:TetR/AcrR family transcriptional regulator [Paraburkholderia sp.]
MPRSEPYHHVNLRQVLLDAAVTLVGEVGPRAFTLREVARRAGVSHNAPYRHFTSKDELLATVAAEGFDRLTVSMRKSMARGQSPRERFELCGCGYVDFALRWPQHFAVMFDLPPESLDCPPTRAAGENAFAVLLECIAAAQLSGDLPAGDPMSLAWTAWSLVHGIAKLSISGNLPLSARATIAFTRSASRTVFGNIAAPQPTARRR